MVQRHESWKKFFVWEAGKTNGAHFPVVQMLKSIGQTDVTSAAECDYLLVFCPVVSRVGTDIGEALHNITPGKPVILVVMHHTFDPHHVVAESRRQVNNPNVHLTVDCLFFEGHLLSCNLNDTMSGDIKRFFGSEFPVPGLIHNLISLWQHIPSFFLGFFIWKIFGLCCSSIWNIFVCLGSPIWKKIRPCLNPLVQIAGLIVPLLMTVVTSFSSKIWKRNKSGK
ncbi:uncharacterized protein LOC102794145 [Neolamprologus brichardi]|uniref:uncharacterized protein LOC102794145 n=1 Tax=Neolamprologus brichardi TaxID=32507 RepID=UPI0016438741|nr:uncharacterized protein LOC102794145 [Neolamprologus brichardi]